MSKTILLTISPTHQIQCKYNASEIVIDSVADVFSLDGISSVPFIEKLVIKDCKNLHDISILKKFQELRFLEIENCPNIKDFSPLNQIKKLKRLKCIGFLDLTILNSLHENANTKQLDVFQDQYGFTGFMDNPNIQLYIQIQTQNINNLKPIISLRHCLKIGFHNSSNLQDISILSEMRDVQDLSFNCCDNLEDLSPISQLPNVNRLVVQNCSSVKSLDKVLFNPALTELEVSDCDEIKSLNIPNKNALAVLKLHTNRKLEILKGFQNLQFLRTLCIENCNLQNHLEDICSLTCLEELGLFYNNWDISEEFLMQLRKIKTLRIWTVNTKFNKTDNFVNNNDINM